MHINARIDKMKNWMHIYMCVCERERERFVTTLGDRLCIVVWLYRTMVHSWSSLKEPTKSIVLPE